MSYSYVYTCFYSREAAQWVCCFQFHDRLLIIRRNYVSAAKILVRIKLFACGRSGARFQPCADRPASVSPLEIMDEEAVQYFQELAEQINKQGEEKQKVRAETDQLKENLRKLKELACKHRSEEEIRKLKDLDKQRSEEEIRKQKDLDLKQQLQRVFRKLVVQDKQWKLVVLDKQWKLVVLDKQWKLVVLDKQWKLVVLDKQCSEQQLQNVNLQLKVSRQTVRRGWTSKDGFDRSQQTAL